jgi:hypothetical protein
VTRTKGAVTRKPEAGPHPQAFSVGSSWDDHNRTRRASRAKGPLSVDRKGRSISLWGGGLALYCTVVCAGRE